MHLESDYPVCPFDHIDAIDHGRNRTSVGLTLVAAFDASSTGQNNAVVSGKVVELGFDIVFLMSDRFSFNARAHQEQLDLMALL